MNIDLRLGDCIEVLRTLPDNSVDSVVCDPPYGLSFMNKKWDYDVPSTDVWSECLRVLKPGGHLLAFGGSRTYHRLAVAVEDAGFEIRDQIMWVYGSGFPKSHNIGKAIDKIQGNKRQETDYIGPDGRKRWGGNSFSVGQEPDGRGVNKKSKGNSEWEGWGTALKPAHEPIVMARKPLSEKSVAENVLKWGTGGINIDDCRIETNWKEERPESWFNSGKSKSGNPTYDGNLKTLTGSTCGERLHDDGRFPANIMFDEEAGKLLDEQSGVSKSTDSIRKNKKPQTIYGGGNGIPPQESKGFNDKGGASRFFYCPKVSKKERNDGLDNFVETTNRQKGHGLDRICGNCGAKMLKPQDCKCEEPDWITPAKKNTHPTVKPIKLMEYLITLVTPKGGVVLDCFMGSGSTGIAARNKGFGFIGIEREEEYMDIAKQRINSSYQTKLDI